MPFAPRHVLPFLFHTRAAPTTAYPNHLLFPPKRNRAPPQTEDCFLKPNLPKRLFFYLFGMALLSLGVSLSVYAGVGVSPISSIPYTLSLLTDLDLGLCTTLFMLSLMLGQALLLGRAASWTIVLQLPISSIFGIFVSWGNGWMSTFPAVPHYALQIVYLLCSIVLIALGIFFYLSAKLPSMPAEGFALAVAQRLSISMPRGKFIFDCGCVVLSAVATLIAFGTFASVREGTVIAALLISTTLGIIMRLFRPALQRLIGSTN